MMNPHDVTRKMLDEGNRKCLAWAIARGWGQTLDELNARLLESWTGPLEDFVPATREEVIATLTTPHDAEFWGDR